MREPSGGEHEDDDHERGDGAECEPELAGDGETGPALLGESRANNPSAGRVAPALSPSPPAPGEDTG
jgi:hypothetical protein